MAGLWFEQFSVEQSFDHEIRRTVLESDNIWFSNATCNQAALHLDAEHCKGTEFGKPIVNSIFTLGLVIGLSVQLTTLGTTIANLGMTDVRFPAPGLDAEEACMKLRSRLFVPGDNERKLAKGLTSPADALILDLEDAVAPSRKRGARQTVTDFISANAGSVNCRLIVRVNPFDSNLTMGDLAAVVVPGLAGIMLPKLNGVAHPIFAPRLEIVTKCPYH